MIERLAENWLDRANERTFQFPFCHSLLRQGYTIIHLTRHGELEAGKDVLAVAPDKTPWAFQLKGVDGERVTISQWRADIQPQLISLAQNAIVHPAFRSKEHHRSCLVINGNLDEAVSAEIEQYNQGCVQGNRPHHRVDVKVRGQLLREFIDLGTSFWPPNIGDLRLLLELYLIDGRGTLPKEQFSRLCMSALPLGNAPKASAVTCSRGLSGCAVLCALALNGFQQTNNYAIQFEGWMTYIAHALSVAERWRIAKSAWIPEAKLAVEAMWLCLARLAGELRDRQDLVEGDSLVDKMVYRVRITHLLGLVSAYALWLIHNDPASDDIQWAQAFCKRNEKDLLLWGEYAVPQFLSYYLFKGTWDRSPNRHILMRSVIDAVVRSNSVREGPGLANPYYSAEEVLPHVFGLSSEKLEDCFLGESFTVESLMHIFARQNFKQEVRVCWPGATKLAFRSFIPKYSWQYYLWRAEEGTNVDVLPKWSKEWSELQRESYECEGKEMPVLIKQWPLVYLAFLMVYPHRLTSSGVRWLVSAVEQR